mmetsp:Transcript_26830/g.40557  ORF Transcript_26830/g.40557 Transcript_26830/m.40557 type:complete len:181 (-) Transcript_26830:178-720(-)|eukprot:scaffold597_cov76-Skeletonema_dohrnii-CCMP3373.AAC.3
MSSNFVCDGPVISDLVLSSPGAGELLATFTAGGDWNTEAKVTVKMDGSKFYDEYIELCDYIGTGSTITTCGGYSGDVQLDLSPLLNGQAIPNTMINMAITNSEIKIKAYPGGNKEYCKKEATLITSSSLSALTSGGAAKTTGFLFGTVALVGLAAYAVKRRNRSKSNNGADQKLNGGELA